MLRLALSTAIVLALGGLFGHRHCKPAELNPGMLMSPEKAATLKSAFPEMMKPEIAELFARANLYWTDEEMPPVQQQGGALLPPQTGGTRDGNTDFPWRVSGGVHNCEKVGTFKFLVLPEQPDGAPWPVVAQGNTSLDVARDRNDVIAWWFPIGTTIGEVLTLTGPDGTQYPFEVRLRTREADGWAIRLFANYTTAANLAEGIKLLRPEWASDATLVAAVDRLEASPRIVRHKVTDAGLHGQNGRTTFTSVDLYETLPKLPADLVRQLLTEAAFEELTDSAWRETQAGPVYRPTADEFSIVPAKYTGAMLGTDRESCMRCHQDTGRRANRTENTWLGRVRGSDGIFSFNPVDPSTTRREQPKIKNRILGEAGIVAVFDPAKHPPEVYRQISFLRHEK